MHLVAKELTQVTLCRVGGIKMAYTLLLLSFLCLLYLFRAAALAWFVLLVGVVLSLGVPLYTALEPIWPLFSLLCLHAAFSYCVYEYDQSTTWKVRDLCTYWYCSLWRSRKDLLSMESTIGYLRTKRKQHEDVEEDSEEENELDEHGSGSDLAKLYTIRPSTGTLSWLGAIDYRWWLLYIIYPLILLSISAILGWFHADENQYARSSLSRAIRFHSTETDGSNYLFTGS